MSYRLRMSAAAVVGTAAALALLLPVAAQAAPASMATASRTPMMAASAPLQATPPSAARQVLYLVNVERTRAGCGYVYGNTRLQTAATLHSQDMVARNYFSHTSPDGRTFVQRIRAQGFTGGYLAENIAAGQVNSQRVVAAWMASPGHRANILNCRYTQMGLGYAYGGAYGIYWTQEFGS